MFLSKLYESLFPLEEETDITEPGIETGSESELKYSDQNSLSDRNFFEFLYVFSESIYSV